MLSNFAFTELVIFGSIIYNHVELCEEEVNLHANAYHENPTLSSLLFVYFISLVLASVFSENQIPIFFSDSDHNSETHVPVHRYFP